jgi:hypothetical protein
MFKLCRRGALLSWERQQATPDSGDSTNNVTSDNSRCLQFISRCFATGLLLKQASHLENRHGHGRSCVVLDHRSLSLPSKICVPSEILTPALAVQRTPPKGFSLNFNLLRASRSHHNHNPTFNTRHGLNLNPAVQSHLRKPAATLFSPLIYTRNFHDVVAGCVELPSITPPRARLT